MGEQSPEQIMKLGMAFWSSKTLLSAVELEIFTELARQPLDAATLQTRLGVHPRSARDFFDALVALGMLQRQHGLYSNTPDTDLFLDKAKPSYIGGFLEMANARLYGFWGSLTEGLKTGLPQNESKEGGDFFGTLYSDPAKLKSFLQSMTGLSMGASKAITQQFPWAQHQTFYDIGSAQGGLVVQVALAHPHITGGGFDLPVTGPIFKEYVQSFTLNDRLQFIPGNFFKDALPKADVLSMGHILHDWNLEEKKLLIAKAYEALPDGGTLIIFESFIDDERRENAFGLLMSLNMLIELPGGFDYTGADCMAWLKEAGFRETRVEHLAGPDSMVIGIK
ncbi:MAG: acetylserotonin O-methyltransferase [Nitrospirota bacterium]|nr:acetylserotonin O-methyltransferase [Nitrospirota bacterium]